MRPRLPRALWISLAVFGVITNASRAALAWKPYTHVYLAEQAYRDAVDDEMLTIYEVDPKTGDFVYRPVKGAGPATLAGAQVFAPAILAKIKVQPRVLQALKNSPAKFFAGALGPDAYPDIVSGQMRIHPPGTLAGPYVSVPDDNYFGPGTDAWLELLWSKAWQDNSDDEIAFALGYLAHAAGDIYAHTFMNTYAGGIFDLGDRRTFNWLKHITVEGYIAERTPPLDLLPQLGGASLYEVVGKNGITGIESYIAQNTWDIRLNNQSIFGNEGNKQRSVPYLLGTLAQTAGTVKGELDALVAHWDREYHHDLGNASPEMTGREGLWACHLTEDCPDRSYKTAAECPQSEYPRDDKQHPLFCAGFALGGAGVWQTLWVTIAANLDAWIRQPVKAVARTVDPWASNVVAQVPTAMNDWVTASHNTGIHLFFTPDHLMHMDGDQLPDLDTLGEGYKAFAQDMESILSGAPLAAVEAANELVRDLMMPVKQVKALVKDGKQWVREQVFEAMFHMTETQAKQCYTKPHMWLNPLLRNNTPGIPGSLVALDKVMRLPPIMPATCGGAGDQCTLDPSLVGTDLSGACDILAGTNVATFSVSPGDTKHQAVFPAAFNALTMIKLAMADPDDVNRLAATLSPGVRPTIFSMPNVQPNAMLGFAATIDGSNDWLATRAGTGWSTVGMVFAQDCAAYRRIFLDQRPNYNVEGNRLDGTALDLIKPHLLSELSDAATNPFLASDLARWKPAPTDCSVPQPLLRGTAFGPTVMLPPELVARVADSRTSTGYAEITVSQPSTFAVASAGKNGFDSALAKGSIVVAPDGKSARYFPPKWNPLGQDQVLVTSKDGKRSAMVPFTLASPLKAGFRREAAPPGDPDGLHASETVQLVAPGGSSITWTIISGAGSVGDATAETPHKARLAASSARITGGDKLVATSAAKLRDPGCRGACAKQAAESLRVAAGTRLAAVLEAAEARRQIEEARATYHAPPIITKDEVVTLQGVDAQGHTATVQLRLLAPRQPLRAKLASTTVKPGAQIALDVDGGVGPIGNYPPPRPPMTWTVIAGPGTVGAPLLKERTQYAAQKRTFLAGLEPLTRQLANAEPFEMAAARKALLDYMQDSVPKYGPAFAKLDDLDRTYVAPPVITGKQRVTLRGIAADGRTVDVNLDVGP